MTIINSVIIGGGGDEVEAYALGDAKNAVKDDKVTLNFSANMATLEPSLSRGPSSFSYYPGAVSLVVGKYLYALNAIDSNAHVLVWEKDSEGNFVNGLLTYLSGRNTSTKPIGHGVRLSYYGKIHQFTEFGNIFDVTTSGSTDSGYVCGSMSQDGNVIMAQYPSDLSPILLTKESGLFIKSSVLNNPNSVQGFWAFTGKKEGSKYYAYVTGRGDTGLKYVCLDVATSTIELLSTHTVQTVSENYRSPVCFKNKLICYNYGDSNKAEVYTFTDDGSLTFSEEDSASLRVIVSRNSLTREVGFVQDGYLICSNDIVGYNQTKIDYKEGVGFFEVFSPFPDKEGGYVNYIGEGYAAWCNITYLPDSPGNSFIRRHLSPVEQPYVATEPITGQFYANQTLTGIVKENNNGVLKVSTVEDPNNPPPAVPDEVGLKTVINYGNAEGVFGSVSVGYGYFRNTLAKPSDKYVSYDGGTLTEDNIRGSKATTMNIILSRSADMGSWTSDTEGFLSAQDRVVLGLNKKLSTPVYLWHDLSYITPIVPETIEPEVVVLEDNAQVLQGVTTTGVTVDEQANITGFDGGGKRMAYINSPLYNKSVSSINWRFSFTTGTTVTSYDKMICGFYDSVDGGDVNGFFLKINSRGQVCLGNGTSSGSYWATGYSSLSTSTRYIVNIKYSASAGYTVIVQKGDDGSVVETLTAATTAITTSQYLVFGCNVAAGGGVYNWNGSIGLGSYYITVDDTTTYFATPYTSVSLPASWKTLDGVVYEYPNGFPKTNATELEVNVVEGSNNLYVTRTGGSCGLAISSTSPAGVDSSAVIGTVELDSNGDIISYSLSEGYGKVIFNGIDVTEHVTEVEVYVGLTRYTISEIPYSVLSEKGILGESGFYTVTKVKPKTGYFFVGDTSYSATSVSLNYVPGYNALQFGTFKDGQYSTFTGELTFKKVEGDMPAA